MISGGRWETPPSDSFYTKWFFLICRYNCWRTDWAGVPHIDLDYCTPVGAGSLGLRLCWICTSEENKWLTFWDSLHTRGRSGGSSWRKLSPLCPRPRAHIAALARKLARKATMFFLTSVYLQPLLHCRCPPCTKSGWQMPQGLCQHASPISGPTFSSQALGSLFNWARPIIMCLQGWLSC